MDITRIKSAIFDLGNVLVEVHPERAVSGFLQKSQNVPRDEILDLITSSDLFDEYQLGKLDNIGIYKGLKFRLRTDFSYDFFKRLWQEMFDPIPSMIAFLERLKSKYTLILLSNTNSLHIEYIEKTYSFFHLFDHLVLSHEVGLLKPDHAIFQVALDRAKAGPEECIFLDDRLENVKAAESLGLHAFQFHGPECISRSGDTEQCVSIDDLSWT